MEIKRTAHKLETNAKTNILPLQGAWHINVWRLVGETCLHSDIFSALCVSDNMLKQSQESRQVSSERAKCFLRIVRHTNAKQRYH